MIEAIELIASRLVEVDDDGKQILLPGSAEDRRSVRVQCLSGIEVIAEPGQPSVDPGSIGGWEPSEYRVVSTNAETGVVYTFTINGVGQNVEPDTTSEATWCRFAVASLHGLAVGDTYVECRLDPAGGNAILISLRDGSNITSWSLVDDGTSGYTDEPYAYGGPVAITPPEGPVDIALDDNPALNLRSPAGPTLVKVTVVRHRRLEYKE